MLSCVLNTLKRFITLCVIALCLAFVLAYMTSFAPAPDVVEFDDWGWCEGYATADDCDVGLRSDGNLSGRIFVKYLSDWFFIILPITALVYLLGLVFVWLRQKIKKAFWRDE
ncbi:hypothetical protein [Moraxella nasicaprae]|uniref:Uncharacterized protein n=1 Tax=Moraxella nasicaprae TaxID=2904122 RepID=A0ABY6F5N8_9GAMM|nr:hypothetical protein [Moraxella nasicaprae]UXZ05410.1 hypothetical protein LU297_02875 [Moraxella nasicaprae]